MAMPTTLTIAGTVGAFFAFYGLIEAVTVSAPTDSPAVVERVAIIEGNRFTRGDADAFVASQSLRDRNQDQRIKELEDIIHVLVKGATSP